MTDYASDTEDLLQVEIFPERLLTAKTAQKLLNEFNKLDGVTRMAIHGPRIPLTVPAGPGKGKDVDHPSRQVIQVADTALELTVCVGRFWLEVANVDVKEEVRAICELILPFPFMFKEGTFFHKKATVSDYAKYGPDVDTRLLGLTDSKRKANDQICIVESKE